MMGVRRVMVVYVCVTARGLGPPNRIRERNIVVPAGRMVFIAGQVGWDEQQHSIAKTCSRNSNKHSRILLPCSLKREGRRAIFVG